MNVDNSKHYDLQMINEGLSVFCIMNVYNSKHDLQMHKWGFKVYFA